MMMKLKHWNQAVQIHIPALEIFLENILKKSYSFTVKGKNSSSKDARKLIEKNDTGIRLVEKSSGVELFLACNEDWVQYVAAQFYKDETNKKEKGTLIVSLFSEFIEIMSAALKEVGMKIDIADINKINSADLSDSFNFDKYFLSTLAGEVEENDKEEPPSLNMLIALSHPKKKQIDAFNDEYEDKNPFTNENYTELINSLAEKAGSIQGNNGNDNHDESISTKEQEVEFEDFSHSKAAENNGNAHNIDLLKDVEMHVSVELGARKMPLGNILQLIKGSVIELEKLAGEPVEILVNGHKIAQGDVVVVDEHFGVRVSNLLTSRKYIKELQ